MSHPPPPAPAHDPGPNVARFFVEHPHIAWVLLLATGLWGAYAFVNMPQRKDPEVQVRQAVAFTPWPGASAESIERLVTKRVEERAASNARVSRIESISRTSVSIVYVELEERVRETGKEFDDIKLRLDGIRDLPPGAGPVTFIKDFGDTAALMLTVASPEATEVEVALRAGALRQAIERVRPGTPPPPGTARFTLVYPFPQTIDSKVVRIAADALDDLARATGFGGELRLVEGPGFVGLDGTTSADDATLLGHAHRLLERRLGTRDLHPDAWAPVVIRDLAGVTAALAAVAGDRYTYRELDEYTDLVEKTLKTLPMVSKVTRSGLLGERIVLLYSQERLAAYGVRPTTLPSILAARNIALPGGQFDVGGRNLAIAPSGEFASEEEIGGVAIAATPQGGLVHLRDLVDVVRTYETPPRYLNYYTWRDPTGRWHRNRAVTLSVQMRPGEIIGHFGRAVDGVLEQLRGHLPGDLILARTSDQPLQVEENVHLFLKSLYEAIALVVLVSFVGFWEWRSALLMALSIPITLAMTLGLMHVLHVDLQQVSIATLIIALGLLVDDPVVAGDAIKRELAHGTPRRVAAWLGPTRLATAILFATITNIVAYLPFLLLKGPTGEFLYSLPVVITCSLVASRVASMTFVPMLGYYLLRPVAERRPAPAGPRRGFAAWYQRVGGAAIDHRWLVLGLSLLVLAGGAWCLSRLKSQFFPKDLAYLSYIDVWLPEDAPLAQTDRVAREVEAITREVADAHGARHPGTDGRPRRVLESLTTFVGGGSPRFWFSVSPELQQLNYAQVIIQVRDKHDTSPLVGPLQAALSSRIAGARVDVRQLETGKPVGLPVAVRISGTDIPTLRGLATRVAEVLRAVPQAERVRDDWGGESPVMRLETDPERANLAGVTHRDVALASVAALSGYPVATLRDGDRQIPVLARLRGRERAQLADLESLYVYASQGPQRVPLGQVAAVEYGLQAEKIRRRSQFRTITVAAVPVSGALASEVMAAARPGIEAVARGLPPGYALAIGGEEEAQREGFRNLVVVLVISIAAIFLALVFQFRHAFKPLIVFAAVPYGVAGAAAALWGLGAPFGFMAFLGIISLIGVIVSHVIVLFDFIEEKHAEGEPLRQALLDAGVLRLRPVLITVGATVIALVPLALHGGPLWEPLCYAQIGGLTAATFITLLLVPVLYSIFVLDLRLVAWEVPGEKNAPGLPAGGAGPSPAEVRSS
jgi:multidrug efflux pump subunit AcrB